MSAFVLTGPPIFRDWVWAPPCIACRSLTVPEMVQPLMEIAAGFAVGLALLAPPGWWALRRVGSGTSTSLITGVAAACFLMVFVFEVFFGLTGWQPWSGGGPNLTADDGGGSTLIDGNFTLHGWESAARRALVASVTGAIVTLVFWSTGPGKGESPKTEARGRAL